MINNKSNYAGRAIYIVDGARTPFIKARTKPNPFSASDLAVATIRVLLGRQNFLASDIGEVITGCAMPSADEANVSRVISLRVGCGKKVPAWTVMRNCASGLQALDNAAQDISDGRYDLVLAGGTDAMSQAPLLFPLSMSAWLGSWVSAKNIMQKLQVLARLRPHYFAPVIGLERGLTDQVAGLSMGQTAENLAYRFNISRAEMDEFAVMSHKRVAQAQANHEFSEITPIFDSNGKLYEQDDGVRPDSSVESLAKLKPYFDKKFGSVTAGNSSQITDGAAFLMLASEDAVQKYNLPVMAKIIDVQWSGCDPAQMGLGPVYASTALMQRQGLTINDIDYWEINEAFAGQVLGCFRAWNDAQFCKEELGLPDKFGQIDLNRFNIKGGAIALGHPIGASGARLVLQLAHILKEKNAKRGIATLCIGGGQGGAMLIENLT